MPIILNPSNGGDKITLDKPIMVIGRHPDCDIVLHDSRKVSRKHCCLAFVNERYLVRDLNSMNGIRINGDAVDKEQYLELGDVLEVGDVSFTLTNTNQSRQTPHRPIAPEAKMTAQPGSGNDEIIPKLAETPVAPIPDAYSQEIPVVIPEDDQKPFSQAEEPAHPPGFFEEGDPTESSDSMNDADSQVEMAY